jgi:uncharacterized protein (DUF58 family)
VAVRTKPTPRLVRFLALGFPALLLAPVWRGTWAWVGAFDVLLLVLFQHEARKLSRGVKLAIEREAGPRFALAAWNPVALGVQSRTAFRLTVRLQDTPPREFDLDPGAGQTTLAPFASGAVTYALRPRARGHYRFGGVRFEAEGALGLAAAVATVPVAGEVRVYPDLGALRRLALGSSALDASAIGPRALRQEGTGDEFDQLREYQPDDDFRDIDWKATAKRSKPVTRVYETERSQRVLLAIDCGRSMAALTGEQTKLDLAVNAALVLAHVALRIGDRVGLALFATEVEALVAPQRGRRHLARLIETLYAVRARLTFVDYRALTREVVTRRMRRGLIVVFTDLLDEAAARPLVDAARVLGRKHAVLVVAPSDPVVIGAARATAVSTEDVYRSLAAREALAERRALIQGVRRLGIEVVDSRASAMALAGVNHYLRLKRRRAI